MNDAEFLREISFGLKFYNPAWFVNPFVWVVFSYDFVVAVLPINACF